MAAAGRTPRTGKFKPLSVKRPVIHNAINIAFFLVKEKGVGSGESGVEEGVGVREQP
jgi:hypothetical protein